MLLINNLCIYGPIINEVIWNEYNDHTFIDLKMKYNQIGTKSNNIFLDFNMHNEYDFVGT